jgi:hypothetical protein
MTPELLQVVVLVAAGLGVVAALLAFAFGGGLYDSIGRGYLDVPDRAENDPGTSFESWNGEAALETRQLIEARSALRRRHGKRALDPEAELRAILGELEG